MQNSSFPDGDDTAAFRLDFDLDIKSEPLRELLAYWRCRAGDREMPSRKDIDPLHIKPKNLPHVALTDVIYEPTRRYRWRLLGTHITTSLGREATGQYYDDIYSGSDYEAFSGCHNWVVENRKPARLHGASEFVGKGWLNLEMINMPICNDSGIVNMIFTASFFSSTIRQPS